jgi:hypothetical protein
MSVREKPRILAGMQAKVIGTEQPGREPDGQ